MSRNIISSIAVTALFLVLCNAQVALAVGGVQFLNVSATSSDIARCLTISNSGTMYLTGASEDRVQDSLNVSILSNGELNTAYGGGIFSTDIGLKTQDYAITCALQPDGKILSGGTAHNFKTGYDLALARYNTNGTLDKTFNPQKKTYGFVKTDFGADELASSLIVQNDGKIVAVGRQGASRSFFAARYTSVGVLDTTFGVKGKLLLAIPGGVNSVTSYGVKHYDGFIIAGTVSYDTEEIDFAMARFNANGTLDQNFGIGGIVTTAIPGARSHTMIGLQVDSWQRIIVGGSAHSGTASMGIVMVRYFDDGSLDLAFGDGLGYVNIDYPDWGETPRSMAVQADGKLIVSGLVDSPDPDFDLTPMIMRLNEDGTFDTTFGDGTGLVLFSGLQFYAINSTVVQADGKIVVAGANSWGIPLVSAVILRVLPNGDLDPNF